MISLGPRHRVLLMIGLFALLFFIFPRDIPRGTSITYTPTGESFFDGHAIVLGTTSLPFYDPATGNAEHDVANVSTTLARAGFNPAEIRSLAGTGATDTSFRTALSDTASHVSLGDTVVVYLSGEMGLMGVNSTWATCDIHTPSPYPNNYDDFWIITHPGAAYLRVKFQWFEVETYYDWAYVANGTGGQKHYYDGYHQSFWSDWVTGDTIRIGLHSDYTVQKSGFAVYAYEAADAFEQGLLLADIDNPTGITPTGLAIALNKSLGSCPAHAELVILECDNAGDFIPLLAAPNRTIWAACLGGQNVHPWPGNNVGAFTGMWARALTQPYDYHFADDDQDGNVSISEAYQFAKDKVVFANLNQQPCACPTWGGDGIWDFDADNDGLLNWVEVQTYGSNPGATDTDGDGWGDWEEVTVHHTNPASADTDGDGYIDPEDPDPLDANNPRAWNDFWNAAGPVAVLVLIIGGIIFGIINMMGYIKRGLVKLRLRHPRRDVNRGCYYPPVTPARTKALHKKIIDWDREAKALVNNQREIASITKTLLTLYEERETLQDQAGAIDKEMKRLGEHSGYKQYEHLKHVNDEARLRFNRTLDFRDVATVLNQPKILKSLGKFRITVPELRRVMSVTIEDFPMSDEGQISFARCLRLLRDLMDAWSRDIPLHTRKNAEESILKFWQNTNPARGPLHDYITARDAFREVDTIPQINDIIASHHQLQARQAKLKDDIGRNRREITAMKTRRGTINTKIEHNALIARRPAVRSQPLKSSQVENVID